MKPYAHILSVVICIVLAAAAANADITVYSGAIYDVVITNPVPVGANPGGEELVGFVLKIVNTSGNPDLDPYGFNGNTPQETAPGDPSAWPTMQTYTGFTTGPAAVSYVPSLEEWLDPPANTEPNPNYYPGYYDVTVAGTPKFHNQFLVFFSGSPTIDEPDFATDVDTHFLVQSPSILVTGTGPSEDFDVGSPWLSTNEPSNANPMNPFAPFVVNDFGNRLFGNFEVDGGAAADIDGDGDPTVWQLAYFAIPADALPYMSFPSHMNFRVTGAGGGENIPEPATMSLLAWGCLAVLPARRRGKRRSR